MPDPLTVLWDRADARQAKFSGDEVLVLGEGVMEILSRWGLVHPIENAQSVPCDACAESHFEEVTYVESPPGSGVRAYLHCPEHGRVRVPLDRLRQWEVDFDGLATAVAQVLELAGDVEEITAGRLWLLGKATIAAESREIFLARGLTWEDAHDAIGGNSRLNAARLAIVLVAGETPRDTVWSGDAPPVVALRGMVGLDGEGLTVDRGHIESLVPRGRKKAHAVRLVSFPTPLGASWSDVRLILTENGLRVEVKGKPKDYTFQEAGFEERRKGGVPDRLWVLLRAFAIHGGVLPFKAVEPKRRTNLKQYVSDLRDRLTALLPNIDGDPISYQKDECAYRTAFKVRSEEGLKFPTPPDATWADVSISRRGTSSIHISVVAKERFASSAYSEEDHGRVHHWEAAEREGHEERDYELRTLGLADDQERPNRPGEAMLSVLAGKGTVKRRADDKGMLKLCGVLSALMDIEGSPFRFAELDGKWVALFDTGEGT